ncbi:MAG: hypothetical protein H7125_04690 [Proteobacteria bacterium]|nr:hypothetical protein [Burkholderiales bacterium]
MAADSDNTLTIITSHTQARYVLPKVLEQFSRQHPQVSVDVKHGSTAEIVSLLQSRAAAIGVIAGEMPKSRDLLSLPYSTYRRVVVVPKGHALLRIKRPTLGLIAEYPLVTYEHSISARDVIAEAFRRVGATPRVILSATDADVIKACVERGLGIAVLPEIAFDRKRDTAISALSAELFPPSMATIAFHRKRRLSSREIDFIQILAPQVTRQGIDRLAADAVVPPAAG